MLSDNKKGLIGIAPIMVVTIALIVLAGIIITLFISSDKYKYLIIGIAVLVGMFWLLGKSMSASSGFTKGKVTVILILLTVGMLFIFGSTYISQSFFGGLVSQTFLSNSQFSNSDGKGYWLVNGVADSIGDKATFDTILPSKGILADGTTVTPTKPLVISISKGEKSCEYLLNKYTAKVWLGVFTSRTLTYYKLSSPERVIEAVFSDDRGNSFTIDGTTNQVQVFTDSDGKGQATVKTVGALSSKYDCPAGNNVVVLKQSENPAEFAFDTPNQYIDSISFNDFINKYSSWVATLKPFRSASSALDANEFITAWNVGTLVISPDNSKVIGTGRDLGNVVYVITADRDYFNSIILDPAKPAIPVVKEIVVAKDINKNSNYGVKVLIANNGIKGVVNVKISSPDASFTPSTTDITLDKEYTFFTLAKGTNIEKSSSPIIVKVCATSQLPGNTCDSETTYVNYITPVNANTPDTCGNGICDNFENNQTCRIDCGVTSGDSTKIPPVCTSFQTLVNVQDVNRVWYNYLGVGTPTITTTPICKTSGWVYSVVIAGVIIVLGIVLIVIWKPNKKKKIKRGKR